MNKRRVVVTTEISKKQAYIGIVSLLVLMVVFFIGVTKKDTGYDTSVVEAVQVETMDPIEPLHKKDPNNEIYPFNSMSVEDMEYDGFRLYEIPEKYVSDGGCLPEVVQIYLWNLCKDRELDYPTVLALIEKESGYKWDALGDNGNSFGYTQIYQVWHLDRIREESVADIMEPYGNLRVCTNFLQYLQNKYKSSGSNCMLMAYNMGESGAKEYWDRGIYSTEYSREILQRAQEIKQELKH